MHFTPYDRAMFIIHRYQISNLKLRGSLQTSVLWGGTPCRQRKFGE